MSWGLYCAFDVTGEPKAQPRPCFSARQGKAHTYTPETAGPWKFAVTAAARRFMPPSPIVVPLRLVVVFMLPRTKALESPKAPEGLILYTAKPDTDNLLKAVMDALTTARLWRDDAQVVSVTAEKVYCAKGAKPGALIQVFTWEEKENRAETRKEA